MNNCPSCGETLVKDKNETGFYWACPKGEGWFLALSYLRQAVAPETVNGIWAKARQESSPPSHPCPSCAKPMVETAAGGNPSIPVCRACMAAWVSPAAMASLPSAPAPPAKDDPMSPELSAEAKRLLALHKIRTIAEKYDERHPEDNLWFI